MKKQLLFLIITFFYFQSQAQTSKGNLLLGGTANISSNSNEIIDSNTFNLGINPNLGYFFIDDLAIGATVGFNYFNGNNFSSTNIGIAPFIRYYFVSTDNHGIFGFAGFGISNINSKTGTSKDSSSSTNGNLGVGYVIFLNSSVGLEISASYSFYKMKDQPSSATIGLGLGFQIYFEKGS